ncbi:MAG: M1 family metallopeptidase [Planctomycetota bacterium]|nr:M1 family metallopeptidase [Planctomycetota bacterium]
MYTAALLLPLFSAAFLPQEEPADLRTAYDVEAYDIDWVVVPESKELEGRVAVTATATRSMSALQLDCKDPLVVLNVTEADSPLEFERDGAVLMIDMGRELAAGDKFTVRVQYEGSPAADNSFDGFHWTETPEGKQPWINTSCQGLGSHSWWPGKASYFHPDDKPERISARITVPQGLYAVTNGRLLGTSTDWPAWAKVREGDWKTFSWAHNYPLETYTVTLNVAPYVVVEQQLSVEGHEDPVPFIYYVLPESAEKAAVQFAQVPKLIEVYSQAFGPWPFPDSKIALVETNFWGMEHSTAVAYGSSFPAWCRENEAHDPYAKRNREFDYILIHEMAHEWWGNAVSADHWGNFWIHEGFGTYAEGVWLEFTEGIEKADEFFQRKLRAMPRTGIVYRGDHPVSGDAYSGLIYSKGSAVLHHLRHCVNDDELWWKTLREFNITYRYKNAGTAEFRALLEANTERDWSTFFEEWVFGEGVPRLLGDVQSNGTTLHVDLSMEGDFHVPLDVTWTEDGEPKSERFEIVTGDNSFSVECAVTPMNIQIPHLGRIPGRHKVRVP